MLSFTTYAFSERPRGRPCPRALVLPRGAPPPRLPAALRLPSGAPARRLIGTSSAAVADFAAVFGAVFFAVFAISPAMYAPTPARGKQKTRARRYINARGRVLILRGAFFVFFFAEKLLFFSLPPRNDNRARPRNRLPNGFERGDARPPFFARRRFQAAPAPRNSNPRAWTKRAQNAKTRPLDKCNA